MLGHDHEVELVGFRGRDQLRKRSGAMSAQKRVDVNDAFVVYVLIV